MIIRNWHDGELIEATDIGKRFILKQLLDDKIITQEIYLEYLNHYHVIMLQDDIYQKIFKLFGWKEESVMFKLIRINDN